MSDYQKLKDMVEEQLDITLSDNLFQDALAYGKRKYEWIISRYGSTNKMYSEEWYFHQILCGCVKSLLFSEYCRLRSDEIKEKRRLACQQ